jgi:hypothetical protein
LITKLLAVSLDQPAIQAYAYHHTGAKISFAFSTYTHTNGHLHHQANPEENQAAQEELSAAHQ